MEITNRTKSLVLNNDRSDTEEKLTYTGIYTVIHAVFKSMTRVYERSNCRQSEENSSKRD